MDVEPTPIASGIHCLGCGYDLSTLTTDRCPECGRELSEADLVLNERRRTLLARRRAVFFEQARWWAVVILIYAIGAGVFARTVWAGIDAVLTLSVAVVLSGLMGFAASLVAPDWDEQLVLIVWTRRLWYLHAPWLLIAFGAGIVTFIAILEARSGGNGIGVWGVGLMGLPIWALGTVIAYAVWCARWTQALRHLGVRSQRVAWTGAGLAAVVVMGAAVLGLFGGLLATNGAVALAGLGGGFSD